MSKTSLRWLAMPLAASLLLAACGGAATPTAAPTAAPKPTEAPKPTAAPKPTEAPKPTAAPKPTEAPKPTAVPTAAPKPTEAPKKLKVGMTTDVGQLNDKSFNAGTWDGIQRAGKEFGVEVKAIESKQPTDYIKNMQQFISEDYDLVIGVGFLMGDDMLKAAQDAEKNGKKTKFAIVDYAYDDKAPKNLTGIVFAEDQSGYLAGTLAGLMTKSNVLGGVYGIPIPPVCKFRWGYEAGAKAANPQVKVLGAYQQPGPKAFNDPEWGKATANSQVGEKADIIFSAGGNTGNGGLLGLAELAKSGKSVLGIGVDQDQWNTLEGARPILLTSAMKKVDQASYLTVKALVDGKLAAGTTSYDIKNDGVGVAPFHDLESKVPADVKAKLEATIKGLKDGQIKVTTPGFDQCK